MTSPMFPLTKNETNFQESQIANQMQMVHLVSGLGYSRLERKRLVPPPGRGQLAGSSCPILNAPTWWTTVWSSRKERRNSQREPFDRNTRIQGVILCLCKAIKHLHLLFESKAVSAASTHIWMMYFPQSAQARSWNTASSTEKDQTSFCCLSSISFSSLHLCPLGALFPLSCLFLMTLVSFFSTTWQVVSLTCWLCTLNNFILFKYFKILCHRQKESFLCLYFCLAVLCFYQIKQSYRHFI